MANEDYIGGNNAAKNFRQDRGGVGGYSGPFEAEVMNTVDPTHSGRIEVWIEAFGDEKTKDLPASWTSARYLSPYYGVTPHGKLDEAKDTNFTANGHAYGMWANVPDPGVKVLVVFSNGQRDKCYYIGFIPEPMMNQMVPAIGAKDNNPDRAYTNSNPAQDEKLAHASRVPVTEVDKSSATMKDGVTGFGDVAKPIHSVLAGQFWKQGTIADPIRGPISSSAQRESPSYVYGISTPGRPIYTAGLGSDILGRLGGHTFVMDDGDVDGVDRLIRIRTSRGHQVTFSDDGDNIYVQHANGNSWIELGKEGTIDGYAANSINFRTGGEINLHADKNINFNAGENINMFATQAIKLEATTNMGITGKQGLVIAGGKVGIKSEGALATDAASATFMSGGHTEIKGGTIGLNDGGAASVTAPEPMVTTSFPDAVQDTTEGWKAKAGEFDSIVTRAPTHEPWEGHNAGVTNVKQPGKS